MRDLSKGNVRKLKTPNKNNYYCRNVIKAKHRGKKKKKIETIYSITQAGYQGWLADGNKGTFEDFLEDQAKVSNKEYLIKTILAELKQMNIGELKDILEGIYDRNF